MLSLLKHLSLDSTQGTNVDDYHERDSSTRGLTPAAQNDKFSQEVRSRHYVA